MNIMKTLFKFLSNLLSTELYRELIFNRSSTGNEKMGPFKSIHPENTYSRVIVTLIHPIEFASSSGDIGRLRTISVLGIVCLIGEETHPRFIPMSNISHIEFLPYEEKDK